MSENQYPVFTGGQSLTASELNALRSFLHARDRLVGRMVGFGVNVGLGGTVSDTTLTIAPGLAVDQTGEPLLLAEPVEIGLAPAAMMPSYDFVDAAAGGFSVVLEVTDEVEPALECGEADCTGHAELHTRGVTVRTVAGRVTGTRMDFAADPLLALEPIRLALDGTPTAPYNTLRDAIASRLTNGATPLVQPQLIANLSGTSIAAADKIGVKGYKAGWLNMVLFAALDLVRVEALLELSFDRTTTRAGVVLGWVHQVGADWVFDCAYRHAWEPPRGFTEAFLGGTCTDPAGSFRDDLEAILAGYAPSDPPVAPPQPPIGCLGGIKINGKCVPIDIPPVVLPPNWRDRFKIDPIPIIPLPRKAHEVLAAIYDRPPINVLGEEGFGVTHYVGQTGLDVKTVLDDYIASTGAIADVKVLPVAEAETLEGYALAGAVAPSDTVVLGIDDAGKVVSTGRVAAVQNVRTVGSALPAVVGAAAEATAAATELRATTTMFSTRLDTLDDNFSTVQSGLGALRTDFTQYTTTFDPTAFGTRLGVLEEGIRSVDQISSHVAVLAGKVDVLSTRGISGVVRPDLRGLDKQAAQQLTEFARTTVDAIRTLPEPDNPQFQQHVAAAERAQEQLRAAAAVERPDDPAVMGAAALQVLGTLRTLVKATGVSGADGRRLDAQVRQFGQLLQ